MRALALLRRHSDAALGAGVAAVYVAEVFVRGERMVPLLTLTPLVVFILWVRRRVALLALAACVATWVVSEEIDPTFNEEGGLAWLATWLVAHYALGRWSDGLVAWSAPAVAVAAGVTLGWDDVVVSGTADLAYFVSISLLPWAVGLFVRLRQHHVTALQEENARLEREQVEAARRAVAEERSRIARELHDVVSHAIAVTVLQSRGARRKLGQDDAAVRAALDAIEQTNAAALGDMRRLLAVLRDTEGLDGAAALHEPTPSLARISQLVDEVRASGVQVELALDGEPGDVPPGVDLSAYRIVQEALTNVLKHAGQQATAVVRLVFGPQELLVSVQDNGNASGQGRSSGHGLLGIRERVAVVGGEVTAAPVDGGGFEVRARLPYVLEVP
ncbi:sensor histidine kinase [Nocardioides caldifontis]|uniref:sensor histidine kinase n=1 Tax=Nocardioides caldifontis TaxID=2588938 RepID=UPI0011DFC7A2|nr:histidine kinase [Nocardioides caldifontis]